MKSRSVLIVRSAGLAIGIATLMAGASIAAGQRGDATVVEGADHSRALDHGGSATVFSLRLPEGASCPGDTVHDQWHVQSFMVPESVDPGSLTYDLGQPHGDGLLPLFDSNTHPFMQAATGANQSAGQPGIITDVPPLSFKVLTPGLIADGTYRIGVACTLDRKTATFWDASIVVTTTSTDHPAGFIWRLSGAPASLSRIDHGSNAGVIAVVVLAVVALLGFFFWRRSRRIPSSTPNPPTRATAHSKESR
jgi:hypothetical protein